MKNVFVILSLIIIFTLGWFGNDALQTQKIYAAAKPLEYKVVRIDFTSPDMEKTLNTYAQQGWRLHSVAVDRVFFER